MDHVFFFEQAKMDFITRSDSSHTRCAKENHLKRYKCQFIGAINTDIVLSKPKQRRLHENTHTRHRVLLPIMVTEGKRMQPSFKPLEWE